MTKKILLIEDNQEEAFIFREAIIEIDKELNYAITIINDGEMALEFFKNTKDLAKQCNIIFLDLNLPKIHGIEILKFLKSNKDLRIIPVIMMSSSENPDDIKNSYNNFANSYIVKPFDFDDLISRLNLTLKFFLRISKNCCWLKLMLFFM